ncbi:MAG: hypothetical protein H7Z16_17435 [Pyrinomonadaceae bacterium]|nr:hypothetical protein [Pyrinomonadaceae bacterium]
MADSMDSSELTGSTIEQIGGSFALGQWLADLDTSFKSQWTAWCAEIQSKQGVAGDDSIVLEAVLDVVRENDIEKDDRKLVFKYAGPGAVSPLKISVAGDDLLEQTYAILTAASESVDDPFAVVPLPEAAEVDWPTTTIDSGVALLPSIAVAPSIPGTQSDVALPKLEWAATLDFVPRIGLPEAPAIIPPPAASATTLTLPDTAESQVVALPRVAKAAIAAVIIPEPATSTTSLPLPGAAEAEIVTLPRTSEPADAAAVIPERPTSTTTLPLPGSAESAIVSLPKAAEPAAVSAVIAEPATSTTSLPLPGAAEAEIVTLPKTSEPAIAAVVLPEPPTSATTLPQVGRAEFATAGQYLLPLGPFPAGASGDETLADTIKDLGAALPQAALDVLGHLKVRKGFLALSGQFKGLVLEVELDQPIRALVRLSMAKVKDLWTFGGEVIIARDSRNGTPQPPLIFTLKFAAGKKSKSLVMALEGEVDLVDDLLRPVFGDKVSIPEGISLKVINPALVLVKSGTNGTSTTKALVAVSLQTAVDFGNLPFVGEPIKAQGDAKMNLGIQYASAPFPAAEIDEINSVLGGALQLTTPDGAAFDGLQLSVALQMTGDPFLLSIPLTGDESTDQEPAATPEAGNAPVAPAKPSEADQADQTIHWIKVNRSVGPAYLDKVGVGYKDSAVQFRVSASVQMSGLSFFVEGLGGGLKLVWPPEAPTFNLDGLGIGLEVPPVSISGALLRTTINNVDSYDGMAVIKAANFTITGLGSYSKVGGDPSLFIYAVLHKDLGGPSFFHVTGLAAGFGYNRQLKLPPIEDVQNFPLVRAALDENYFNPPGTSSKPQDLIRGAMEKLRDYIPPSGGDYWFAAGIRFNSFEMIRSFALLSVSFGHEVEIGLLGLSKMSLPKGAEPGSAVAYAELALRAVVNPDEGIISVEGRLTDKSYIFSQDCHLTGGFAFYLWLKDQPPPTGATEGAKGGDFVVTLGGYHPRFVRPAHYPIVPRLGINWRLSSELTVTAEMYFALTPSCLMAGGKLSAVFQTSCIKAWYVAYADLLLSWRPFYYLVDMGISIGVEATVRVPLGFATITISIRVELSVDLHLWGPPFAGEAHIDLSVISFTIPFGPEKTPPDPLTAPEFVQAFLPAPKTETDAPDVIAVRINSGLLRQREKNKEVVRVVNAHALSLTAESVIPSTRFDGLARSATHRQPENGRPELGSTFGIRPMAKQNLTSSLDLRLLHGIKGEFTDRGTPANLRASFVENGVPDALWGRCEVEGQVALPSNPEAKTITATAGVRFSFLPIDPEHALFPIPLEKLKFEQLPTKTVVWQDLGEAQTIPAQGDNTFWNTIWANAAVDAQRNAILDILSRQSPFAMNKPKLDQLQQSEGVYFQADPEFSALGEQLK